MAINHHILEELARQRQLDIAESRSSGLRAGAGDDGTAQPVPRPRVLDGRLSLRAWRRAQADPASGAGERGARRA